MFFISIMSLVSLLIAGFHFLFAGEILLGASIAGTGVAINTGSLFIKQLFKKKQVSLEKQQKDYDSDCFTIIWQEYVCGCCE